MKTSFNKVEEIVREDFSAESSITILSTFNKIDYVYESVILNEDMRVIAFYTVDMYGGKILDKILV